ncbi:MAG: hypothetical protein AAGI91_13590 [Bacteroidota bacterium]
MTRTLLALSALLLVLPGCDTGEGQNLFFEQSSFPAQGLTVTDESGTIEDGSEDPDDWRVAPFFANQVTVRPAFPNPVARNGLVTITVQDTFGDALTGALTVTGRRDDNRIEALVSDQGPDFYTLTFNPTRLRLTGGETARLYRVRVFDGQQRIVTYGDILVR